MCSNMINRISILFATAILLFAGCKKETKTTVPEIDGQWQVLNFAGVLSNEYYLFNSTNKTVYNLSKESGFEFRDYQKGVFNIKGNSYRLIIKINFDYQMIWIRFIGTHAEYDKINLKTI